MSLCTFLMLYDIYLLSVSEDNSTQFTSETEVLARSLPTPETNTTKEKALKTTADTNAETSTEISQTSEFPLTEMTRKGNKL